MLQLIRRRPAVSATVAVVLVAFGAWLAFGFFGVHKLFVDDVVDDDGPVFASGAVVVETETPATSEAPAPPETTVAPPPSDETDTGGAATTTAPAPTTTTQPPEPQIVTLVEGSFTGSGRYDVEGRALVLNDGSQQRFLRFEDFAADNGPDLDVYLSAAPADADGGELEADWILLDSLRGNIGDQNYELDPSIDLDRYSTVVIWCTRFGALFGTAELT